MVGQNQEDLTTFLMGQNAAVFLHNVRQHKSEMSPLTQLQK